MSAIPSSTAAPVDRRLYCRECGGTCGGRHAAPPVQPRRFAVQRDGGRIRLMYASGAVPIKEHGGKLVSARSKTGLRECSEAVSRWKTQGQDTQTALTLAKCRAVARAKGSAQRHRAAGNEARAQHLEHVAASAHVTSKDRGAQAKSLKLERLERLAGKAQGAHERLAAAGAGGDRYTPALDRSIGLKRAAQREEDRIAARRAELGRTRPSLKPGTKVAVHGLGARPYEVVASSQDRRTVHVRPAELTEDQKRRQRGRYGAYDRHVGAEDVYHAEHAAELTKLGLAESALRKGNRALASKLLGTAPAAETRSPSPDAASHEASPPSQGSPASAPPRPAKGTTAERLSVLASRAGGLARRREAAGDLAGRDVHADRKARLARAAEGVSGKAPGAFRLSAGPKPAATFSNAQAGRTGALFDDMAGAAARDLPGQTDFLGSERPYEPGRERADLRTAEPPPGMTLRQKAESSRLAKVLSGEARSATASKLKTLRERLKAAAVDPASHTNHAPGTITPLKSEHIHFDPERFQYKLAHNAQTGSVGSLEGVKSWNPELAGILQVWKDPANGKVYVVNGHNRLDRAKRLGVSKVNVQFIDAASAEHAKAKGALTNIAEGHGTAVDAANFFKNTGIGPKDLEAHGITMKGKLASEGSALANLDDPLFRRVIAGTLHEDKAKLIGASGLEPAHQHAIVKQLDKAPKARPISTGHLRELLDNARAAGTVKTQTFDLFGASEEETSLALHRAKVQEAIKDRLSREKRLFGTVAKTRSAAELARGGNTINTEESGRISQEAAGALDVFDRLKRLSGPVSQALNQAAERLHAGHPSKHVTDEAYQRVLAETQRVFSGGEAFAA